MYKDFYCYPAVLEQGESVNVFFPDFDGCVSGGNTVEEAIKNAREALSLHVFGMEEDGEELPDPSDIKSIELNENQYTVLTDINYGLFKEKMEKKAVDRMVTLPKYLNAAAKASGINISQVLQEALRKKLGV